MSGLSGPIPAGGGGFEESAAASMLVAGDELRIRQVTGLDALAGLVSYARDYLDDLREDWAGRP